MDKIFLATFTRLQRLTIIWCLSFTTVFLTILYYIWLSYDDYSNLIGNDYTSFDRKESNEVPKSLKDYVNSLPPDLEPLANFIQNNSLNLDIYGTIKFYPEQSWIRVIANELYIYSTYLDVGPLLKYPLYIVDDPHSSNFLGLKMVAITRRNGELSKKSTLQKLYAFLGLTASWHRDKKLLCDVKFINSTSVEGGGYKVESIVVDAILVELPEHHSFQFTTSILYCPLARIYGEHHPMLFNQLLTQFPIGVQLVIGQEDENGRHFRVTIPNSAVMSSMELAVATIPERSSPNGVGRIATCIPPLFTDNGGGGVEGGPTLPQLIISILQTIEWSGLYGVDLVNFYLTRNGSSTPHPAVPRLLHHYSTLQEREQPVLGRASILVRDWELPAEVVGKIHYNGQVGSVQDCLFASGANGLVDILMFHDIDELIFPLHQFSYRHLFSELGVPYPMADSPIHFSRYPVCGFSFRSATYVPTLNWNLSIPAVDWMNDGSSPFPHAVRSKLALLNPSRLTSVGIHEVIRYPDWPPCTVLNVDPDVAFVKHFRHPIYHEGNAPLPAPNSTMTDLQFTLYRGVWDLLESLLPHYTNTSNTTNTTNTTDTRGLTLAQAIDQLIAV